MSQAIFIVLSMFVDTQTIQSFFLISGLLKVSDLFFDFFYSVENLRESFGGTRETCVFL